MTVSKSSVSLDAVSKRTGSSSALKIYRFQNLREKIMPFSCEREAYPSHFPRFQNVSASSERSRHYVHTLPAHFENGEKNLTAAKFMLAFTRCRNNSKTVGHLTINMLLDVDGKEIYLPLKNRSVSFRKHQRMFHSHNFRVFTRRRLQNVPVRALFSKPTAFRNCQQKCAVFV